MAARSPVQSPASAAPPSTVPSPVLRFAPSPNGRLHLGHAHSALVNRRMADRLGGRLLLRLEDIDPGRCTPELERGILDDLDWLGVAFDGPVVRQSERIGAYADALDRLRSLGLAYPAFMSRREARALVGERADWPHDPDGAPHYPPLDRERPRQEVEALIESGALHAWRLDMGEAARRAGPLEWAEVDEAGHVVLHVTADPLAWGDAVLSRVDAPASYHLAATVDDAAQGVTHVVRGRDLLRATAVHRLLQTLLGLPVPLYRHHGLIVRAGTKLAKSRGDGMRETGLNALRAAGLSPGDARAMIGWSDVDDADPAPDDQLFR